MTAQKNIGELLAATAAFADWLSVSEFESSARWIIVMNEELCASLSYDRELQLLCATFDVAPLPEAETQRNRAMEALLNANAFRHESAGVGFGVSPHDDAVTLSALLPARDGCERELATYLSRLGALTESWRGLLASFQNDGGATTTQAMALEEGGDYLTFRP
jgi:hypothetical protein